MTERYFPIHQIPQLRDALRTDEMEVQGTGGGASARVLASSVSALGGQPGPTGPAGPTMIRSPYDFGAVGNGTTDDTLAMQAWLNCGDGILYGKPGTFMITPQAVPVFPNSHSFPLLIKSNTTILGAGKDLFIIKTDPSVLQDYALLGNLMQVGPPGIYDISVAVGGSGYAVGDTGHINQTVPNTATAATYQVFSVDGSGGITALLLTGNGANYVTSNPPTVPYPPLVNAGTQPGTGSGATVNISSAGDTTRVDHDISIYGVGFEGSYGTSTLQVSKTFVFVYFAGVDHLTIRDCSIHDRTFDGITLVNVNDVAIDNNEFYHIGDPRPATITLTSLTSSGTTATATFSTTPAYFNGSAIGIRGATPDAYNGQYNITFTSPTTFVYTFGGGTSPATGTIEAFADGSYLGGQCINFQRCGYDSRVTNNYLHDVGGGAGIWMPIDPGAKAEVVPSFNCTCIGNMITQVSETGLVGICPGSVMSNNTVDSVVTKDVSGHCAEMYGDNYTFTGNTLRNADKACAIFGNITNVVISNNVFDLPNRADAALNGALGFVNFDPSAGVFPPNNVTVTGNMMSCADGLGRSAILLSKLPTSLPGLLMNNFNISANNFGPPERWSRPPIDYSFDFNTGSPSDLVVDGPSFLHRNNQGNTDVDPYQSSVPITNGQSGDITVTGVPFQPRTLDLISNISSNSIMSQCVGPVNNSLVNNSSSISSDSNGFVSTVGTGIKLFDGTPTLLLEAHVTAFTSDGFVITITGTSGTNAEVIFTAYP